MTHKFVLWIGGILIAVVISAVTFGPRVLDLGGALSRVCLVRTSAGARILALDGRGRSGSYIYYGWTLIDPLIGRELGRRYLGGAPLSLVAASGDTLWMRDPAGGHQRWRTQDLAPAPGPASPPRRNDGLACAAGELNTTFTTRLGSTDHGWVSIDGSAALGHLSTDSRQHPAEIPTSGAPAGPTTFIRGRIVFHPPKRANRAVEIAGPPSVLIVHHGRLGEDAPWIVSRVALNGNVLWSVGRESLFPRHPARLVAIYHVAGKVLLFAYDPEVSDRGWLRRRRRNVAIGIREADGKAVWRLAF